MGQVPVEVLLGQGCQCSGCGHLRESRKAEPATPYPFPRNKRARRGTGRIIMERAYTHARAIATYCDEHLGRLARHKANSLRSTASTSLLRTYHETRLPCAAVERTLECLGYSSTCGAVEPFLGRIRVRRPTKVVEVITSSASGGGITSI